MSKGKENINVIFAGRYNFSEILSGPEKVAKRIYSCHSENSSAFIQYFFDGRKYGLMKKLFGKMIDTNANGQEIYTLGLFRILSVLVKLKPDIVHVIMYERFALIFFIFKMFLRYKIIYNPHGIISLGNKITHAPLLYKLKDKFTEKIFIKFSNKIIFPSEHFTRTAHAYNSFNESKAMVIPNGVDECFKSNNNTKITNNELNIIIETGKIGFEDSLPFISDAFKKVKGNICVNIIGNNNKYITQTENINIVYYDKMTTEGFSNFLNKMDVMISLIKYDSFSISTAEAMAKGVIPIVNMDTGIADYIENGNNGFKIKCSDSELLANYINALICDAFFRKQMSVKAADIYNKLSWDKIYTQYKELYSVI